MKIEFTGIVKKIKPTRTYGANKIEETEFWCVEQASADSKYPNVLPFVVKRDPTRQAGPNEIDASRILQGVNEGDVVNFAFQMRGRQWDNPNTHESRIFVDNKVCSYVKVISPAQKSRGNSEPDTYNGEDPDVMPF